MARAQGARAQMALAFETTYGTPPVGGFTKMPFASTSLGAEQPLLNSELLGYGRDPLAPIKDAVTADGDVVVPLDAEAFGFWLKAAFGDPTTTGTGPWTHEFQSGAWTLPSMSIETGMPEVPRYAMYSGCVLDQINWQMQRSGLLTATARLVAQGETVGHDDQCRHACRSRIAALRPFQRRDHPQRHRPSATSFRPTSPTPTISTGSKPSARTAASTGQTRPLPR